MFQVEIVCDEHNRALTPVKAPKQPFGRQWAIYNFEVLCEAGNVDCKSTWRVVTHGGK